MQILFSVLLCSVLFFRNEACAEPECLTKKGYFVAVSEGCFDMAAKYAIRKDYTGFKKLLDDQFIFRVIGMERVCFRCWVS